MDINLITIRLQFSKRHFKVDKQYLNIISFFIITALTITKSPLFFQEKHHQNMIFPPTFSVVGAVLFGLKFSP